MSLPVTLDEAKAQLRADGDEQDAEILDFIRDAADWVEGFTGHILEAREVTEQFRGFGPVALRAWPIAPAAVPAGAYLNDAGAPVALVGAQLDLSRRPARVLPPAGTLFWPFCRADQLFTITIRAGYETPADVPRQLCRAMLVLISAYDADREGGSTFADAEKTAQRLCHRFKRHAL
jgi:uncharacterized phiE125 gp8 family phage protein